MEQYDGIPTHHLVRAARRVTEVRDAWLWVATDLDRQWTMSGSEWALYERGQLIEMMTDDEMRANVTEQLDHMGVSARQINHMMS